MSQSRSFRLACAPEEAPLVEALLEAEGFVCEPEPFFPLARRLLREPFPLGRSQAAFWGRIYIQDRSSMLPPLALNPDRGAAVLDMCASPGSKTSLLAQLVGRAGLVLANEPSRSRLATLRRNLLTLNLLQTATCSWPGETLPLPPASWNFILLDPPCSGWGTVEKHPQAARIWRGKKILPLVHLQRALLREACRLLAPGGRLVYSTCTTNVDENEGQIRFAQEELGLERVPLSPFPGFTLDAPALPDCEGCLRVVGRSEAEKIPDEAVAWGGQGFFVACLTRSAAAAAPAEAPEQPDPLAAPLAFTPVPTSLLTDYGLDPALLPPGRLGRFGATVHMLPALTERLPSGLRWQGAAIGKAGGKGCLPSPRLRLFAPVSPSGTEKNGEDGLILRLDLEDVRDLAGLAQGRSLDVADRQAQHALLFWRGLPLGRLRLKNGRALWTEQ